MYLEWLQDSSSAYPMPYHELVQSPYWKIDAGVLPSVGANAEWGGKTGRVCDSTVARGLINVLTGALSIHCCTCIVPNIVN